MSLTTHVTTNYKPYLLQNWIHNTFYYLCFKQESVPKCIFSLLALGENWIYTCLFREERIKGFGIVRGTLVIMFWGSYTVNVFTFYLTCIRGCIRFNNLTTRLRDVNERWNFYFVCFKKHSFSITKHTQIVKWYLLCRDVYSFFMLA